MSSKRRLRRKACDGKVKRTEGNAREMAAFESAQTKTWINAYKCKFCHFWHIGHPPKSVRRRALKRIQP